MNREAPLQPTLWRTCRVLANRKRLRILKFLFEQPGQNVSAVAAHLRVPLPVASLYLRALEARGLLIARRVNRRTIYRPSAKPSMRAPRTLLPALKLVLMQDTESVEQLFKLATAFTHPRRIEVFRLLAKRSRSLGQIVAQHGMCRRTLRRHLKKLESRNFVVCKKRVYRTVIASNQFSRALALLASV